MHHVGTRVDTDIAQRVLGMAVLRERERLFLESEAKDHRSGRAACRASSGWAYLSGLC